MQLFARIIGILLIALVGGQAEIRLEFGNFSAGVSKQGSSSGLFLQSTVGETAVGYSVPGDQTLESGFWNLLHGTRLFYATSLKPGAVFEQKIARPLNNLQDQNVVLLPNGSWELRLNLLEPTFLRLRLFDSKGRLVRTLVDEQRSAGVQTIPLYLEGLAPAQYFFLLEKNGSRKSGRIQLNAGGQK